MSLSVCPHCGAPGSVLEEDSVYHTLVRLMAFEGDREALFCRIGICDPHDLICSTLESPVPWWAVMDFAETIIGIRKEVGYARDNEVGEVLPD